MHMAPRSELPRDPLPAGGGTAAFAEGRDALPTRPDGMTGAPADGRAPAGGGAPGAGALPGGQTDGPAQGPGAAPGAGGVPTGQETPSPAGPRRGGLTASRAVMAVSIAGLVALTVLGSVLNVGDHLMRVSPALGWVFYALVATCVAAGVVVPVLKVARRPVFSLYQLRDEQGRAKRRRCRMLVENLESTGRLDPAQRAELRAALEAGDQADDLLIDFFRRTCVPQIDEQTKRAATTAFLATAISHSALVDTVTMLSICLDLVRSIVEVCGFRPTTASLARLYTRVMLSALVAGGLDEADLDGLLGTALGGGAGARASGIVLGSAASGMVSAFLTFRVGVITRDWLCSADGPAQMASVRRASYRQALDLMKRSGFLQEVADVVKRSAAAVVGGAADMARGAARNAAQGAAQAARSGFDAAGGLLGRMLRRDR